jgi:phosphoribosylanthranilate isomerase
VEDRMAGLGLDLVQLHGDEPASEWSDFPSDKLIRALRIADRVSLTVAKGWQPRYFLFDAAAAGYGGSGKTAPWPVIAESGPRPFILAGGLGPENVAAAIAAVRPEGVDVASGVESSPGVKDPAKVAAFIARARAASR